MKNELLVFQIQKSSVLECDPSYLMNLLRDLSTTRKQVLDHEGCLTFVFEGWDNDPRETAEIPEIRVYFAALTQQFPYWLHYIERSGETLFHLLRLLCTGHYEGRSGNQVGWTFDDLEEVERVLHDLFNEMNRFHHRHSIPHSVNRRISEAVGQWIRDTLLS